MSLTVNLYSNYSDPTVVHKRISLLDTVYCEITESTSIDEPSLLLDIQANVKNFNYCYIPEFNRYYFCTVTVENGHQMRLNCVSDPLMSFWAMFSSSPCIAERSTSHPNPDLVDELLPFKNIPKYTFRTIGAGFTPSSSSGCYILTLGGK